MQSGKFISVEGPDGAGKTTNLDVIEQILREHAIEVVRTREPGGTILGEQIRRMLLEQHDLAMCDEAELLLIFAARAQHVHDVISPALAQGQWVLCDRFTDATRAYQGGGRGVPITFIDDLAERIHPDTNPDLTFIFDVAVDVAEERLGPDAADRFETQAHSFKQRVRDTYSRLASTNPNRVHLINTERARDCVATDVETILKSFIRASHP